MIRDALARLFGSRPAPRPSYDPTSARAMVASLDIGIRRRVAEDPLALPELLAFLARDSSPVVRRAVAANLRTPRDADLILAMDESAEVRALIARKVAQQIETLPVGESSQIWQMTVAVLEALAHDNIPRVRQLLAEAARNLSQMPPTIVATLGKDRQPDVAVPALGYPGKIEDRDLVEIVEQAPDQRVVGAVAQRPAIGPSVAEAVVDHGDEPSIAVLLANTSAQIPPRTLDRVVERAPPVEAWHEPLVKRPQLSEDNAVRLAQFVADRLVQALQARPDLEAATGAAINAVVQQRRLAPATTPTPMAASTPPTPEPIEGELVREGALSRARRHFAQGTLGEDLVVEAIGADPEFLIAALALRARLGPAIVAKILAAKSAKGLTALCWKAGFSMRLATQLQIRHARLPGRSRINPGTGGTFPLTPAEMEWQIEFFRTLAPAGH